MSAYSYRKGTEKSNLHSNAISHRSAFSPSGYTQRKRIGPVNQQNHYAQHSPGYGSANRSLESASDTFSDSGVPGKNIQSKSIHSKSVQGSFVIENLRVSGDALMNKINDLVDQGNVHRIVIKNKEGHTLLSVPTTVKAMGRSIEKILSAEAAAISVISAIVPYPKLVIEKFG